MDTGLSPTSPINLERIIRQSSTPSLLPPLTLKLLRISVELNCIDRMHYIAKAKERETVYE